LFPRFSNAAKAAIAINEATSAYSIAFAPRSHRISRINVAMPHPLVNQCSAESGVPLSQIALGSAANSLRKMVYLGDIPRVAGLGLGIHRGAARAMLWPGMRLPVRRSLSTAVGGQSWAAHHLRS